MDIKEFKRVASTDKINRHPWETTRARIARYLLQHRLVDCKALADIGSGDAFVLQHLRANNTAASYTAIDNAYTPTIIDSLQQNGTGEGIRFFNNINEAFANRQFTCVLLMDIIEHCSDDDAFLNEILKQIDNKTTTSFLITVPAFQSLFSGHDTLLSHYRRYTVKKLEALCARHHLTIITSGYFFFSLLPARLLQLLAEKAGLRKTEKAVDAWTGGHFVSTIFSFILWLDFRICYSLNRIHIRLPGLSCYCLCQKSAS